MKTPRRQIRRILVPVDFSKRSLQVIPTARRLADLLGAKVHLANVQDQFIPPGFLKPASPAQVLPISHREAAKRSALQRLQRIGRGKRNGRRVATS